jgi:hypothetical protein
VPQPRVRASSRTAYLFGVAVACLLLTLGLSVLVVGSQLAEPFDPSKTRNMFDSPGGVNILIMGWVNTWPQRFAHRIMLVTLAAVCAGLSLLGPRRGAVLVRGSAWPWAPLVIGVWISLMLVLLSLGLPTGFEFLRVEPRQGLGWAIGVPLTAGLFFFGRRLTSRRASRGLLALVLLLLAGLTVPAFWDAEDLTRLNWQFIEEWQAHYEILFGPADRLAAGHRLGEGMVPLYGLVTPVILGGVQRSFEPWTLGDYVHFVQAMQLVFLAMLLPSYARYAGGRWLLVLPAILLASLDFHFRSYLLIYPNLMGMRFLGFPVAFLAWWWAQKQPEGRAAVFLGGIAGACLLYNLETGVAVAAGLAVCVALRRLGGRQASGPRSIVVGLGFAGGMALVAAGLLVLNRALLGDWIEPGSFLIVAWHMLVRSEGGFGGGPPTYDPLALVIFGHAAAVLVWLWVERGTPLSFRRGARALAASVIVVWFGYYSLRPNLGSLSSLYAPYGFLLLDTLRVVVLGARGRSLGRWKLGLSLAILALLVLPRLVLIARYQTPTYLEGVERAWEGPPRERSWSRASTCRTMLARVAS